MTSRDHVAGFGPVSADIARQILASQAAAAAQWRFSAVGPGGELLAHGLLGARPTPPDATAATTPPSPTTHPGPAARPLARARVLATGTGPRQLTPAASRAGRR